jgi:D-alanine transaminase
MPMARVAYVNGRYRPLAGEAIALEDRGYQFADGVYEVIKVLAGRPRDLERHLDRLQRSLAALEIAAPMSRAALTSATMSIPSRRGRPSW